MLSLCVQQSSLMSFLQKSITSEIDCPTATVLRCKQHYSLNFNFLKKTITLALPVSCRLIQPSRVVCVKTEVNLEKINENVSLAF